MRVLIIEDEPDLAGLVARGLRHRGMAVDVAHDGEEGRDKARVQRYEIVILDRDLPRLHGDAVCHDLRARGGDEKILMLTASGDIRDRVVGLALGADDYLTKPFAFAELAARVEALGRRSGPLRPPTLRSGDLELDEQRMRVRRDDREIDLNAKEFGVLRELMRDDGAVLSSEELLRRVWDENADPFTNTVRVTVMRLRRKLGDPDPVETVIGAGYRMRG